MRLHVLSNEAESAKKEDHKVCATSQVSCSANFCAGWWAPAVQPTRVAEGRETVHAGFEHVETCALCFVWRRTQGAAFTEFRSAAEARRALEALNGAMVGERRIRVAFAVSNSPSGHGSGSAVAAYSYGKPRSTEGTGRAPRAGPGPTTGGHTPAGASSGNKCTQVIVRGLSAGAKKVRAPRAAGLPRSGRAGGGGRVHVPSKRALSGAHRGRGLRKV